MADALSRVPGAETLQLLQLCSGSYTLGIQHVDDTAELAGGAASLASVITIFENDSFVQALKQEQQECKGSWFEGIKQLASRQGSEFVYRNGLVCKLVQDHFCPVLPDANSSTVQVVLADLHGNALGGHLGFRKLLAVAQRRFFWQHMHDSIKQFIKRCSVC